MFGVGIVGWGWLERHLDVGHVVVVGFDCFGVIWFQKIVCVLNSLVGWFVFLLRSGLRAVMSAMDETRKSVGKVRWKGALHHHFTTSASA